jgi:cell division protein FtsZ
MRSITDVKIAVVSVGDGGGSALNRIAAALPALHCIAVNTSNDALLRSTVKVRARIGRGGSGTGGHAEHGRQAAEESIDELYEVLRHIDQLLIVAAFGGGTGTGASPIIARVAKELGAEISAVVSTPFTFEGAERHFIAKAGIAQLEPFADSFTLLSNDSLLRWTGKAPDMQKLYDLAANALGWNVLAKLTQ